MGFKRMTLNMWWLKLGSYLNSLITIIHRAYHEPTILKTEANLFQQMIKL